MEINTTSNIVFTDVVGIIDCGSNMVNATVTLLKKLGVSKLNYIVYTHMHGDHIEKDINALAPLKEFISTNTPIYIQMCPYSSAEIYSEYTSGINAINSLGGSVEVPEDQSSITIGKTKLTFFNTDSSHIAQYSAENSLNLFSIVTKVEYGRNTYINCGDIEWGAQYYYTNAIGHGDLVMWPHHGVDAWDNYLFINQFSPKAVYASREASGKKWDNYTTYANYYRRYLRQNPSIIPYTLNDGLTTFTINKGVNSAKPFSITSARYFFDFLDCNAQTGKDINEYINWTIYDLFSYLTHINSGECVTITTDINAQFTYQFYAILCSYSYAATSNDMHVTLTYTEQGGMPRFIVNLGVMCVTAFSMTSFNAGNITLRTFTSYDDVESKYPRKSDASYKTFIGEWYDLSNKVITYMPRICTETGQYTNDVWGLYYMGPQSVKTASTLNYFTAENTKTSLKPLFFRVNSAISYLPASTYRFIFSPAVGNWTKVYVVYGHIYVFMINDTHMMIFEDGVSVYDSSTDDSKVSILSIW